MQHKRIVSAAVLFIALLATGMFNTASPVSAVPDTVLSLELNTNVNPVREQYGLNLQQTLREIGIDLTVNILEWGTFVGAVLAKPPNYQLGIIGFSFGLEPDLGTFFHTQGGLNLFGPWNDSYNDGLLEAGVSTLDAAERKIIYDEWQEHLMDELPGLPIVNPTNWIARQLTIGNYYPQYGSFYPTITRADGESTLIYGSSADPVNLNPMQAADDASSDAYGPCLDGMYTNDYDTNVVPALASSLPIISEDGLTWTIPLRDDIYWHDGEQFNAEDVYFTVMSYIDNDNFALTGMGGSTGSIRIDNWEAIYDLTNDVFIGNVTVTGEFEIEFELPDVYAPFLTSSLMTNIVPEHLLNVSDTNADGKISDETAWQDYKDGEYFIGTGPYYFTADDWEAETQFMNKIRTDRDNPYWPGTTPDTDLNNQPFDITWTDEDDYQITKVITRTIAQMATQIAEFESGGLDFVSLFANPELIEVYQNDARFNVTSSKSFSYNILHFNTADPVFAADPVKGKALRKAIAYAFDRENVVETIHDGRAVVCDNPIPPSNVFYYNWDNPINYRYNIETALGYMELAGYDVDIEGIVTTDPAGNVITTTPATTVTPPSDDTGFELFFLFGLASMGLMVILRRRR
ncbi:MAG: hypothetical protein KAR35_06515 [Candidatus Heimdallarchaeota archaeon]|nr:hypothetical protein [Candidatus Heimdallarchaeota archaeon]MCK5049011.1 hypothetical protein [Candidatus Heimdallarchaeota archaeon]